MNARLEMKASKNESAANGLTRDIKEKTYAFEYTIMRLVLQGAVGI